MNKLTLKNLTHPMFSFGLSAILFSVAPEAFSAEQEKAKEGYQCDQSECVSEDGLVFRVKSLGESTATETDPKQMQKDRRVDVGYRGIYTQDEAGFQPDMKRADVSGNLLVQLPNGGIMWATEDPALTPPSLGINGASVVAFKDGKVVEPVNFSYYSNYAAFIDRLELSFYDANDTDLVTPLATQSLEVTNNGRYSWEGDLTLDRPLVEGDRLIYVLRAYDKEGRRDETVAKSLLLVTPEEKEKNIAQFADLVRQGQSDEEISDQQLANELIESETFGQNNLRQQNIPIYGSRVRIFGQDIPENQPLTINGDVIPVDLQRRFVAEYLLPVGQHKFNVVIGKEEEVIANEMTVNVTGEHMFMVALADLTASENNVSDSIQAVDQADQFQDDFLLEGRLAFYLKGKVKGKYLITAQADTQERELDKMFSGFLDKDPQDIFRRLDPDRYYPVYGDDSTTYRDVDTQGRFYVRVDWDKSQALWGNYNTGITGNEFAQYSRSLYGAAINWRSIETTELGEAKTQVKAFASEAQTALGHVEFLGTGGSLYYLKHTDILPGSDKITLEVRDNTTGRVETRVDLKRGADYEIDELQGRIILTTPLSQISRRNLDTIIRDQPLDGFDNVLLVDYEYRPSGFEADNRTVGGRAKVWLGEHVAVGGTFVDENRSGDDYQLAGVDVTLQAGRGTYLKVESADSEANQAATFFSDNGGFTFDEIVPDPNDEVTGKEGGAYSVEARANFKELGWSEHEWKAGAWHRETDAGFSVARRTLNEETTETGAEVNGYVNDDVSITTRASDYQRGNDNRLKQAQVGVNYQITPKIDITAEVRQLEETLAGNKTSATLGAVQYNHRIGETWDVYGVGQFTLENDGGDYDNNDLVTLGTRYLFGNRSSIGAEYTSGHRGDAASLTADYQINNEHKVYGRYTYSTDTTDNVFGNRINDGIVLGQKLRLSNQVTIYNESQHFKAPQESGLVHTFGMDYYPSQGWTIGFNLQDGNLDAMSGPVDRQAATVSGSYRSKDADWTSKIEYREDSGAEEREQWLTTNRLTYRLTDDWRLAARINYADTEDLIDPAQNAKFVEGNLGFAYRPVDNNRWAMLGKYTYLYDLRTLSQITTGADQKSDIYSFEGTYNFNPRWKLAAKVAHRRGQVRENRGSGAWFKSTANLYAAQTRYHIISEWDALLEYRWLELEESDDQREGWLIGADYHISDNFKIGAGYNFTEFSDNLANLDFNYEGWFINFVGKY
ncbi:TonB-dependent receptor [Kangiella spongicola]|uniref:Uncharacterized protein n=1 Tax=Kangiella spongicola TaxID=796379 RepID=A0A318D3P0_9GAMM|nr:hypothetical protein [Kangiella spongicola]PXF62465.1 hypothetical protein DL796_08940 [Kangiella spongicola]